LSEIPLQMGGSANPIGPGFGWVRDKFVRNPEKSTLFLPSVLDDNPGIDKESYRESLKKLPEAIRKRLEEGSWEDMRRGEFFDVNKIELVPQNRIPKLEEFAKLVRFWDLAGTEDDKADETVGCLLGITHTGRIWILDIIAVRLEPAEVSQLLINTAKADGPSVTIGIEQEPGQSGKAQIVSFQRDLAGYNVVGIPSTGSKAIRAIPVAGQISQHKTCMVIGHFTAKTTDQLDEFPFGLHDDRVDAIASAYSFALVSPRRLDPGKQGIAPRISR